VHAAKIEIGEADGRIEVCATPPAKWRTNDCEGAEGDRNSHKETLHGARESEAMQGRRTTVDERTEKANTKHEYGELCGLH
jgi:hypothetical protein